MIHIPKTRKSKRLIKKPLYTGATIAKYFGIIYDNTWSSLFHLSRTSLVLISGMLHFLLENIYNYDKLDTLTFMEVFHYFQLYFYAATVICALLLKSQKFETFCMLIKTEFVKQNTEMTPKQKKIIEDISDFIKRYIKVSFAIFSWTLIAVLSRRPLFESTPNMTIILDGYIPFEVNTWLRYFMACLFQIIVSTHVGYLFWCLLVTYTIHSKHLCGQFEILSEYIKETFDYVQESEIKSAKETIANHEQYMKHRLQYIIKEHHRLLRCFDLFQDIYSYYLLAVSVNCGLVICTAIYMITDPSSNLLLIVQFISLLLPAVFITGCYCWFGQQVKDWWTEIGETIYSTNWYMESITTQKTILNIMTACTKNKAITGGKLQEFSLKGLSELLQAAFSYFNMLKAMR